MLLGMYARQLFGGGRNRFEDDATAVPEIGRDHVEDMCALQLLRVPWRGDVLFEAR